MALALRIASAPRCATAYRPSSRKQVVVRAGFCNVHAGLVRTFTPSPYGNKQWAGTASGFNAKISRHATTRRAVNDEAVSAKEATQEAVETVREAGSNILSDVTKRANEMGEAAKDTSNQAASATKEAVDKTATKAGEAAKDAYTNLGGLINGVEMPSVKLSSGHSIPVMGLGTWKAEPGEVKAAVETAIRMGYRHVDCAKDYGNEHEVGEALATIFSEGVVKREELFITSKLWNTDHGDAVAGAKESLKKLQLDYMDLYLIHWPASGWPHPPDATSSYISTTWASMESLAHAGLARSIGVSNLSVAKMGELLKACTIKPSVNQVESHPYWRNNAVRSFCNDNGVHMTAYASLGTPRDGSGVRW
ncbi:hypothetical protein FOA52_010611 [Chlamydomonas sp. UWO 241]|nr:hypothetical protein FOA52_010611 [Chlamydomonas sp. UWO 241]